jgi:hypothetical protein
MERRGLAPASIRRKLSALSPQWRWISPRCTVYAMPKIVPFHEVGGPEVLKIEELPAPTPQKGEVRLKVEAIGLNRAEITSRKML